MYNCRERPSLPLRTLTTGSERSKGGFLSLEHPQSCVLLTKTPAKTQDHPWSDVCQPPLRTLTTGSERSNRERPSHPVRTLSILGSVLTGSDRRSLLEHSLPVASVLRAPDHPNFRKKQFKPQFTTGSERSKEPRSSQFLKKSTQIPIHYR